MAMPLHLMTWLHAAPVVIFQVARSTRNESNVLPSRHKTQSGESLLQQHPLLAGLPVTTDLGVVIGNALLILRRHNIAADQWHLHLRPLSAIDFISLHRFGILDVSWALMHFDLTKKAGTGSEDKSEVILQT
jgi:hypothetical protein